MRKVIQDRFDKGESFENYMCEVIKNICNKKGWYLLVDLYLNTSSQRGFTQIDFVIIANGKVFCIEAKNWSCTLKSTDKLFWKILYDRELIVLSPLAQNEFHINKIKKFCSNYEVVNIVCFSNEVKFLQETENVYKLQEFVKFLEKQDKLSKPLKTRSEVIYKQLLFNSIDSELNSMGVEFNG